MPVRPRPPVQATSTRSASARRHTSSTASRASARSLGSHQSGHRTQREGQPTGAGGLSCRYSPNSGGTSAAASCRRPRPRTSRPDGKPQDARRPLVPPLHPADGRRARGCPVADVATVADAVEAYAQGWARLPWAARGEAGEAELAQSAVTVRCLTHPPAGLAAPSWTASSAEKPAVTRESRPAVSRRTRLRSSQARPAVPPASATTGGNP